MRRLANIYLSSIAAICTFVTPAITNAAPAKPTPKRPANAANALPPRLYDLKGIALETTLDEFRKLAHPDGKVGRVVCTGDNITEDGRPASLSELSVSQSEAALGVVKCAWWGKTYKTMPEQSVSLSTPTEGYIFGEYTFDFIADPRDGQKKFFRFFGMSNSNAHADIIAALTTKFGPTKSTTEAVQNGFGAQAPNTVSQWANPLSILTVKERWLSMNKMALMLTDNRLLKVVNDADEVRRLKAKNQI